MSPDTGFLRSRPHSLKVLAHPRPLWLVHKWPGQMTGHFIKNRGSKASTLLMSTATPSSAILQNSKPPPPPPHNSGTLSLQQVPITLTLRLFQSLAGGRSPGKEGHACYSHPMVTAQQSLPCPQALRALSGDRGASRAWRPKAAGESGA